MTIRFLASLARVPISLLLLATGCADGTLPARAASDPSSAKAPETPLVTALADAEPPPPAPTSSHSMDMMGHDGMKMDMKAPASP
jgi:hypothetical protein